MLGNNISVVVRTYLVISVRKVEPSDIHAGIHQSGQALLGPASRADGTNNLGATAKILSAEDIVVELLLDVLEGDVPAAGLQGREECKGKEKMMGERNARGLIFVRISRNYLLRMHVHTLKRK